MCLIKKRHWKQNPVLVSLQSLRVPSVFVCFVCWLVCVLVFRAAPAAYGSSQARGQIGAKAASIHHSQRIQELNHICDLHHSSQQRWIPDPLSEARDQICILMDTSRIHFCCITMGTRAGSKFSLSLFLSSSASYSLHYTADCAPVPLTSFNFPKDQLLSPN